MEKSGLLKQFNTKLFERQKLIETKLIQYHDSIII